MNTLIGELEQRGLMLVSVGVSNVLKHYGIATEEHPTGMGYIGDGTWDPPKQCWAPTWAVVVLMTTPGTREYCLNLGRSKPELAAALAAAYILGGTEVATAFLEAHFLEAA
jgi:hypothetical protein